MEISKLVTEQRNPNTMQIDQVSTVEMVTLINQEDQKVALAIEEITSEIAEAIDAAAERFQQGGRLIYIGAGTSGRLGALDAIELTPTYGVLRERAFGLLAGGETAMYEAVEGAEDSKELAISDLKANALEKEDVVIALAASGRTPYALAAIEYGNAIGAMTISITCTKENPMTAIAKYPLAVEVGPEVITGSTRMKAGTAQKMILNMLSTGIMIKIGKVYQNLMVNVQATNEKLIERSLQILSDALDIDRATAEQLFEAAKNRVNVAIVMFLQKMDVSEAERYLAKNNNRILEVKS